MVWKTENEQNYTNFTVERSSDGGKTFNVLGGFLSSALGTYSFLDKNPPVAADQYRLKLEDLNGTISYSNVVTVMYANTNSLTKGGISLYPNPAKSALNLTITPAFSSLSASTVAGNIIYGIKIVSNTGTVIKSATTNTENWQTDVSYLVPGTYVIQVVNNSNNSVVGSSPFIKL